MSDTNPTKTELVPAPVTTSANVQITMDVADGLAGEFADVKFALNKNLRDTVALQKKAAAAAAAAKAAFVAGVEDHTDSIAAGRLANVDSLATDLLGDVVDDLSLPERAGVITYISHNEKARTRIFSYVRKVKYAEGSANNPDGVEALRGELHFEWKLRILMTTEQNKLLDTYNEQTALAAELDAEAKKITDLIHTSLPALKEYAVDKAKGRWFRRAEGAEAIYDDTFKDAIKDAIAESVRAVGLSPEKLLAIAAK